MDGAPLESRDDSTHDEPRRSDDIVEKEGKEKRSSSQQSVIDYITKVSSLVKQKHIQDGLEVCDEALKLFPGNSKLLEKKVKVLCQLHQFQDAFRLVQDWVHLDPQNSIASRELEKLKIILSAVEGPNSEDEEEEEKEAGKQLEEEAGIRHEKKIANDSRSVSDKIWSRLEEDVSHFDISNQSGFDAVNKSGFYEYKNNEVELTCTTCDMIFTHQDEMDFHNHSYLHRQRLALDSTHRWQFRAPPRGLDSDEYSLCKRFMETGRCTFGEKCTRAHSVAELEEWDHRYVFRKQQLLQSLEAREQGGTYIEQLLEKLMSQEQPKMVLVENMDMVKVHVNCDLKVSMSTKKCTNAWTFTVTSKLCLHCVALMLDTNRSYFHIVSISVGPRKTQKYQNLENQCQEWVNQDTQNKGQGEYVYRVKIVFKTDIYGTFRQTIVFDFGVEAILMREVQVESAPATDPEKIRKEITLSEAQRWNERTVTLVSFEPRPVSHSDSETALITKYTLPRSDKFCPPETVMRSLSKDNYRLWMHEMLYIEEMAQVGYISRFNVTTSLQLVDRFLLLPSSLSTARYAQGGEMFARLTLEDDLSEDSMAGRLILQSSNIAWIAEGKKEHPEKVYEAVIEDKGKNFIFMRLSRTCVTELGLSKDREFTAQIQFQLNRLSMCEMHSAVDRLPTLDIVFPNLEHFPNKLDLCNSVLQDLDEEKQLNEKQKDAIRLILADRHLKLPPLLIVGPFGTGKTFTMAQAAKWVLKQEGTRILICTHSNSAADLYIKEFLHDYASINDHSEARPLRIMYKFRWIQTVPEVVLEYTLLEREGMMAGTFRAPTVEDILKHRIIIATLSSARYVVDLDLPKDTFSHVFIDEAAQSLESETIIPLSVASENTRIVFAGDHMQMSPEVYSDFTRQQGFHTSLLERLHELFPKECVYKVMLCENYRAHSAIIDFTSELFYDRKLISSGNIVAHEQFYPLTFYAAKGEEIQHENSTGFCNLSEVYEIVERVDELKKKWPEAWGPFDNNGIGVLAPYSDQVARIRAELRKRKLFGVNVERVLNVQGKQYRAVVLSVTRTRLTCRSDPNMEEYLDFGFLSNIKLLNTAITRAQSLVIVVGDPVSVCLVGKCRKIWEYFLEICDNNNSLHGISWVPLKDQLDRAELTKSFVLNPLAAEFVPSRLYHIPHMQQQQQQDHGVVYPGVHVGAWPGFQTLLPGQPFPSQMFPSMYQPPMYYPYNPGLLPAFYPQTFNRGMLPNRQMFGRFMPPGASFPYARGGGPMREGIPRTVEMPGNRGIRHNRGGGRQMYYNSPRLHTFQTMPQGYSSVHHPQNPVGGYFYQLPEDPMALAFASSQSNVHPYQPPSQQFSSHGLRPPVTAYGVVPHQQTREFSSVHTQIQSQSLQSDSRAGFQEMRPSRERSDTADSSGGRSTGSPSSGLHLLPNTKHTPAQLLGKLEDTSPETHEGNETSPAMNISHGSQILRNDRNTLSNRPYSPANYPRERSGSEELSLSRSFSPAEYLRERAASDGIHARKPPYSPTNYLCDDNRSSEDDVSSSHERSVSISPPVTSTTNTTNKMLPNSLTTLRESQLNNNNKETARLTNQRRKPNLKLNTGFSRQYSDDLPTPTVITNMIQMIDENLEEGSTEDESPSSSGENHKSGLKLRMTVAQRLQNRQTLEDSEASSSSTPPSADDYHPSYSRMIYPQTEHGQEMTAEEAIQMEIQTPRTPKGFMTPGADVEVDPFGILKSLNIGGNHSMSNN
uniref:C3H1-type domain-containing protein n=1 Tax=Arion vulgaris TaxID=1028688 RepID=A0A0B7B1B5_9EUPU